MGGFKQRHGMMIHRKHSWSIGNGHIFGRMSEFQEFWVPKLKPIFARGFAHNVCFICVLLAKELCVFAGLEALNNCLLFLEKKRNIQVVRRGGEAFLPRVQTFSKDSICLDADGLDFDVLRMDTQMQHYSARWNWGNAVKSGWISFVQVKVQLPGSAVPAICN